MIIDKFLAIETKYNLYDRQLEGVNYWIYSRFAIWMMIQTELQKLGEAHRGPKPYKNVILKTCRYLLNTLETGIKINRQQYDLLIFNHQRRIKNGNSYECIYTDWLSEYFPNQIVCERPYNGGHFVPNESVNLFYVDGIIAYSEIEMFLDKNILKTKYRKIKSSVYIEILPVICEINCSYGCNLNINKVVDCIISNIYRVRNGRPFYEKILKMARPKVIVELVHYSWHTMLINELARKYDIPTIEFQHGSLVSEPAVYCYSENILIAQLPMYLYTFSDYWSELSKLPRISTKTIAVGYPYLEQQINKYLYSKDKPCKEKAILFVSQGTIGESLSHLAVSLSDKIGNEFHIIYKLHPGEYYEWKERYPWLLGTDIQVIDSLEHSIYEYFAQCEYQVAVASTAVYEGLAFQLKTFLYDCGNGYVEGAKDLVGRGYARLIENEDGIIAFLQTSEWNMPDIGHLWKMDAKDNIVQEIYKVMNKLEA